MPYQPRTKPDDVHNPIANAMFTPVKCYPSVDETRANVIRSKKSLPAKTPATLKTTIFWSHKTSIITFFVLLYLRQSPTIDSTQQKPTTLS